jgi:hypothetical protein
MDDYRTRHLDADFEEPESEDEEQEGEAQDYTTPPPLPPVEEGAPPPLPVVEEEAAPQLPKPDLVTPPLLPDEEESAVSQSPVVFYEAPSAPRETGGSGTVTFSEDWYSAPQSRAAEVPSPFEEPVITAEPPRGTQAGPITPEVITSGRGGGAQMPPPTGPGAPKKKNQTWLIVGIVVAVLLLLCCCCAVIVVGLVPILENMNLSIALGSTLQNLVL